MDDERIWNEGDALTRLRKAGNLIISDLELLAADLTEFGRTSIDILKEMKDKYEESNER